MMIKEIDWRVLWFVPYLKRQYMSGPKLSVKLLNDPSTEICGLNAVVLGTKEVNVLSPIITSETFRQHS